MGAPPLAAPAIAAPPIMTNKKAEEDVEMADVEEEKKKVGYSRGWCLTVPGCPG